MRKFKDINLFKKILFFIMTVLLIVIAVAALTKIYIPWVPAGYEKWFEPKALIFYCLGISVFICLFSIHLNLKSWLLLFGSIALFVGGYFNAFENMDADLNIGIVIACMLAFQVCMLLYTTFLFKSVGVKVLEIAIWAGVCAAIYVLLPQVLPEYFASSMNCLFAIYLANVIISVVFLMFHLRNNKLLLISILVFMIGAIFIALANGGIELLGITGGFADFVNMFDWGSAFMMFGTLLYCIEAFFFDDTYVEN